MPSELEMKLLPSKPRMQNLPSEQSFTVSVALPSYSHPRRHSGSMRTQTSSPTSQMFPLTKPLPSSKPSNPSQLSRTTNDPKLAPKSA